MQPAMALTAHSLQVPGESMEERVQRERRNHLHTTAEYKEVRGELCAASADTWQRAKRIRRIADVRQQGAPSPGADVARCANAKFRCRCGRGEPSLAAHVGDAERILHIRGTVTTGHSEGFLAPDAERPVGPIVQDMLKKLEEQMTCAPGCLSVPGFCISTSHRI
jgi:hypothetical protein